MINTLVEPRLLEYRYRGERVCRECFGTFHRGREPGRGKSTGKEWGRETVWHGERMKVSSEGPGRAEEVVPGGQAEEERQGPTAKCVNFIL